MEDNEDELNNEILSLEKKINILKNQLKISLEKENLHQQNLSKIKKIHSEYEESYLSSLNEYKNRENILKNQYTNFKNLLEKQNKENEERLYEELNTLTNQLKKKDETIILIQKKNIELNNKISKNKVDYHFKENDLEDKITLLDREISQIKETSTQLAEETNKQIQSLLDKVSIFKNNNYENNEKKNINNIHNQVIINDFEKIHFLEIENNILRDEIKKIDIEIKNWKNKIPEYNDLNNQNFINENDSLYFLKIKRLENKLESYFSTIKSLKDTYKKNNIKHEKEIKELKNFYENQLNHFTNVNISNISPSNNGYNNYNLISSSERRNTNNLVNNLNLHFPIDEGIRNQLIRGKIENIKKNAEKFKLD